MEEVAGIFAAMIDLSKDWTGAEVQELCDRCEMSQRKLASMLGLRVMTINNWVTGKVQPSRIASIALTYIAHDLAGELILRRKK